MTLGKLNCYYRDDHNAILMFANDVLLILSLYQPYCSECVFFSGNASLSRSAMEDLLRGGWLMDSHIDAFVVLLNHRRVKSPKSWRNFIYISPSYAVTFIHIIFI